MIDQTVTQVSAVLNDLLEQSRTFDVDKHDYEGMADQFQFDAETRIFQREVWLKTQATLDSHPLSLTDWAFQQMLGRLGVTLHGSGSNKAIGKSDMDALKRRFPELFAPLFNGLLQASGHRKLLIRAYKEEARAVLSDKYAMVQNTAMLEGIATILNQPGAETPDLRVVRSYVNPDDMHVRIVWKDIPGKDGKPGNYGVGVYVGNGETGNQSLVLRPLIQRHSCTNSIVLNNDEGIRLRHIGNPTALIAQVKISMLKVLPLAAEAIEKVYAAEEQALPSFADIINGLAAQHGWNKHITDAVKIGSEGEQTRMGLVNGITYAAKKHNDINAQADMEMLGGRILVAPDSLFDKAAKRARQVIEVR